MDKKNKIDTCYTGLSGLDRILQDVRLGDNVVFQIDRIEDYIAFVHPFCHSAQRENRDLIYFRFADHQSVIPENVSAHVYKLRPEDGFENFISEIFTVIEKFGKGAFYVFDSLSELSVDWYSDRMLGNFFMLDCPYLFDYETVAYFAMLRNHHTSYAVNAIHNTAQVVLDIYRHKDNFYVLPLKVDQRYSNTMYMLHRWEGDAFIPVTLSTNVAEILAKVPQPWLDFAVQRGDIWTRTFTQAKEIVDSSSKGKAFTNRHKDLFHKILRMAVTREPKLLDLAEKYFELQDLTEIGKRMIGTGLIGGKSVGMLIARAILEKTDKKWSEKLEPHDSFFIGSDVFYTYLIQNKCWWLRREMKSKDADLKLADEAKTRMLSGSFPEDIENQFVEMLNYFGQSPIIVRSSSLMEDAYGNAFSGKYESVFCANQGTPKERLEKFKEAVRTVYASTLSREALGYRERWGLLDRDEQMAILVQRVSGSSYGYQFFPQIAGVGFSFNPYVWNEKIDPKAGLLRLVFGLGTRAVERVDDDYTRIIALNMPHLMPHANVNNVLEYTQRKIDLLDLQENALVSRYFEDMVKKVLDLPLDIFASRHKRQTDYSDETSAEDAFFWALTFDKLLDKTSFIKDMKSILHTLEMAYKYPVDIEFTVNFIDEKNCRINLLQCRPFQAKGNLRAVKVKQPKSNKNIIFKSNGPVIGSNMAETVDRLIYVVPEVYGKLTVSNRYAVARAIGRLTHNEKNKYKPVIMLVGPGRWATSMPELGVPVSSWEINPVSVLCEVALMHEGLIPEVSLGTHFFNDLVEMDMLYFAIHPEKTGNVLNKNFFETMQNSLGLLSPEDKALEKVIKVIDFSITKSKQKVCVYSDVLKQNAICYLGKI
jgi:hypothetical protein